MMRTPRPTRAFLSMIAFSMIVSAPMPTGGMPRASVALHLVQRLVVVGADQQAVADARPARRCGCGCRSPRDRSRRRAGCSPRRRARCGCCSPPASTPAGSAGACRPGASRRRNQRAGSRRTARGWPGSTTGSSRRPPSSRGRRSACTRWRGTASGMTWRPKSTSLRVGDRLLQHLALEEVDAHRREVAGPPPGSSESSAGQPLGRRLLVEVHDAPAVVHLEDAERGRLILGDGNDRHRRVGAAAPVRLEHRA